MSVSKSGYIIVVLVKSQSSPCEEKHSCPLTFERCKPLQSFQSGLEFISLPLCNFSPSQSFFCCEECTG